MVDEEFFGAVGLHREALLWVVAARRQIDRWESAVAEIVRSGDAISGQAVWRSEAERHLALVAAARAFHAARLTGLLADEDMTLADDVKGLRDMGEHWDENMPVFNVWPRKTDPPRSSGKRLAERFPEESPFSSFGWSSDDGPRFTPSIPAVSVHEALGRIEAGVLAESPRLSEFIPERDPSPWLGPEAGQDQWWPKP